MTHLLAWLALVELLAFAWFLIAWPLFVRWPDRGFGVSKAAGVTLFGVFVWTLAWIPGVAMTAGACWSLVAAITTAAGLMRLRRRQGVPEFFSSRFPVWFAIEAMSVLVMALFLLLRVSHPEITGAEKFMDFALLNAAIRSPSLPLEDPWLSGFHVNYYHFGFVTWAGIDRMLGTPSAVAYNLAVATIPGLVAAAACSIACRLTGSVRMAIASSAALVLFGNLAGALQIRGLVGPFDIFSPTRIIPGTINEFPFFTFLWADLHPHLLAMPNFLVFTALVLVLFESTNVTTSTDVARSTAVAQPFRAANNRRANQPPRFALRRSAAALAKAEALRHNGSPGIDALLGASAGVAAATSPWDLAPFALMVGALVLTTAPRIGVRAVLLGAAAFTAAALVVALPFMLSLEGGRVEIGMASAHSPFGAFLLVQALWMLPAVLCVIIQAARMPRARLMIAASSVVAALAGILSGNLTVALLAALMILSWAVLLFDSAGLFVLIAPAFTLLLGAELFYVDAIYGHELARMNIVFKFHLQAILLLTLASGACIKTVFESMPSAAARRGVRLMVGAAVLCAAVYPLGSILSALLWHRGMTLDGTAYLKQDHADDLAAIGFLTNRVGSSVIAEATGPPYSYFARISANTGLPTMLGWENHEIVWRRGDAARAEIAQRADAVRTLYEGDSVQAADIARQYHVRYIVVGEVERQSYPKGDFDKFEIIGHKVFESGGTTLVELNAGIDAP